MELPQLNRTEWEAMMTAVLSDVSIDPTDKWATVQSKGNNVGTKLTEIPADGPEDGGPVLPTDALKHNTDESSGAPPNEIPADGGFTTKVGKPEPTSNKTSTEIPADGPTDTNSPADKPNKEPESKFGVKVGRPVSTKKPSGSFAKLEAIKYDGDAWGTKDSAVKTGTTTWNAFPTGRSDGTGPDATPTKSDTLDRAKGASGSPSRPGEDKTPQSDLQMADGTFFTQNTDDLINNIQKVQNADKTNPRADTHPWYTDIKRHLMNRAADLGATHLIPKDWQIMMAMLAEAEMADYNTAERRDMAKRGHALADGSYPIGNAHDLHSAIILARSGHGDVSAAKALIRKRAKELGVTLPPDMKGLSASRETADYNTAERRDLAKKGWALPNGSYPIKDAHDLHSAMILARSGHGDVQAAKALIRRRAKDLGVALPADMK